MTTSANFVHVLSQPEAAFKEAIARIEALLKDLVNPVCRLDRAALPLEERQLVSSILMLTAKSLQDLRVLQKKLGVAVNAIQVHLATADW
jgi:hypothetical protein